MAARKPPESWFWSHDIDPRYLDDVMLAGSHLLRLSVYGTGAMRRFASVSYRDAIGETFYRLDVPAAELAKTVSEAAARPISVTADVTDGQVRFSLVLQKGPGSLTSLHQDLDEAGLAALADEHHCVSDVATYVVAGTRKYAAIVEERPGPCWVLCNVSAAEIDAKMLELGATLTRVRRYLGDKQGQFVAVAEKLSVGRWGWYGEIDGDTLGRQLDVNTSYPFDLDAYRDERGVRFTVVMYRDRD
jgi:hypothetical protein